MTNNTTPPTKQVLLGLTLDELTQIALDLSLPKFVGKQLCSWLYEKHVRSFDEMTNLSKVARQRLSDHYLIGISTPVESVESRDGTIKYLYRTVKGHYIETVYLPEGDRATLCVSSQVGCRMGCAFCMTGRQGLMAQLSAADILNQIYSLPQRDKLTNIVFMGQGEPFDNLDEVLRATQALTAEWGFAWSPRRITVSTAGVRESFERFIRESQCALAISIHHPNAKMRRKFMPAEKDFSIEEMVEILSKYDFSRKTKEDYALGAKQRKLTFEYIVFRDFNDTAAHGDELIKLLSPLDCKVNLIRFHEIPNTPFNGTDDENMLRFRDYLSKRGLYTTIRASRGQDIYAACGMLTTKKLEEERA